MHKGQPLGKRTGREVFVYTHVSGKSCLAVAGVVACLAAAVAGCSSSSSSSHTGSSAAGLSPTQAVLLAARSAEKINTFSGTFELQGTVNESGTTGPIDVAATVSGELRPSLLASENYTTFNVGGENLGPVGEVISAKDIYVKLGIISQALHTSKPWVELPLSTISAKSGINFSSLLGQSSNSDPLTTVQLLGGASDVKKVGTGTIDGTPVTEYSGTTTIAKSIDELPADTRAGLQKAVASTGVKTASFKVWLDSSNQALKAVVVEDGTAVSETITVTLTSVNQPVTITPPPASQVTALPASALSGS
jgi:hypothetical protein